MTYEAGYASRVSSDTTRPGLRAITRDAVRGRISQTAIDLFVQHGYENVTIEQIAATVGISPRSFHRYFPAKEDTVIEDPAAYGALVRDALASRPSEEPVWASLRAAYIALLEQGYDARGKATMRLLSSTAALRARNLEKHLLWADLLVPVVEERLSGADTLLRARAIVQASLACFDVALTTWAEPDEQREPIELLDIAFHAADPHLEAP